MTRLPPHNRPRAITHFSEYPRAGRRGLAHSCALGTTARIHEQRLSWKELVADWVDPPPVARFIAVVAGFAVTVGVPLALGVPDAEQTASVSRPPASAHKTADKRQRTGRSPRHETLRLCERAAQSRTKAHSTTPIGRTLNQWVPGSSPGGCTKEKPANSHQSDRSGFFAVWDATCDPLQNPSIRCLASQ